MHPATLVGDRLDGLEEGARVARGGVCLEASADHIERLENHRDARAAHSAASSARERAALTMHLDETATVVSGRLPVVETTLYLLQPNLL